MAAPWIRDCAVRPGEPGDEEELREQLSEAWKGHHGGNTKQQKGLNFQLSSALRPNDKEVWKRKHIRNMTSL